MEIVVGYWAIPALFTLAAFTAAWWATPAPTHGSYFPDFGSAVIGLIYMGAAAIASLVIWLI